MFKILIVDDEKIVLDAVKYILEKEFPQITLYEIARSGREAIEKAEIFNPDIIMMDIRMPGINGIDAIKEIKSKQPKIHFVIVSAYEQFDFAKEAVELKVDDYILKPIIKNKLVSVLRNIMDKITIEKEIKKKELEIIEKYEKVNTLLEYGFIYSIILGEHYNSKLNKYKEILELDCPGGYIMLIEAKNKEKDIYLERQESDLLIENEEYNSMVSDALKCKCRCFVGPAILGRVVVYIYTINKGGNLLKKEALEIAQHVYNKILDFNYKHKIQISIGSYQKLENISKSFDDALIAIKHVNNKEIIVHISDIKHEGLTPSEYPKDKENRLIEQIDEGDLEGALDSFNTIYKWVYTSYNNSFEIGRAKLAELYVAIHRGAFGNGIKETDYENYLLEFYNIEEYLKLEKVCNDRLIELIYNINFLHKKKNNKIIIQAKEYIYENFNKDITLEEVARIVSVTPHYFSRLFKEETGENFIEYLTIFRIKKAKKMMDTTNLNIKEICYKIGYTDPNYFSRLFKKVEKVTPTDYMKNSNKS